LLARQSNASCCIFFANAHFLKTILLPLTILFNTVGFSQGWETFPLFQSSTYFPTKDTLKFYKVVSIESNRIYFDEDDKDASMSDPDCMHYYYNQDGYMDSIVSIPTGKDSVNLSFNRIFYLYYLNGDEKQMKYNRLYYAKTGYCDTCWYKRRYNWGMSNYYLQYDESSQLVSDSTFHFTVYPDGDTSFSWATATKFYYYNEGRLFKDSTYGSYGFPKITRYTYNNRHLLTEIIYSTFFDSTQVYWPKERLFYDEFNRPIRKESCVPRGRKYKCEILRDWTYDIAGNLIQDRIYLYKKRLDAVSYFYDSDNRLTKIIHRHPQGWIEKHLFSYYDNGWLQTAITMRGAGRVEIETFRYIAE